MDTLFCLFDVSLQGFLALAQAVQHLPGTTILISEKRASIWAFPHESLSVEERIITHERPSGSTRIIAKELWEALQVELKGQNWAGFLGSDSHHTPDGYLQSPSFEAVYEHATRTLSLSIYPRLVQNSLVRSLLETFNEIRVHELLFNTPLIRKPVESFVVTNAFISIEEYAEEFKSAKEAILEGRSRETTLWHECLLKGHLPPFQLLLDLLQKKRGKTLAFLRLNDISLVACLQGSSLPAAGSELQFGYLNAQGQGKYKRASQVAYLRRSRLSFSVASQVAADSDLHDAYNEAKTHTDSFLELLKSSEKTL